MALTKANNRMIDGSKVNVLDFGADDTGATDSSSAFTLALAAGDHVIVPKGTFALNSMITIGNNKCVELQAGVFIRRKSSLSASTDPVFWLNALGSTLRGAGQQASFIINENKSPAGVVRVGPEDLTTNSVHVQFCTVKDLYIAGQTGGGQSSGDPDACIYLPLGYSTSSTNYYHTFDNLRLSDANIGLWLDGFPNAHKISNVTGLALGANNPSISAMFKLNCTSDTVISNCMFTGGAGVTMFDMNDNASEGTRNTHNTITNVMCEQGGSGALLDSSGSSTSVSNFFGGVSNAGANNLNAAWRNGNTTIVGDTPYFIGLGFPATPVAKSDANTLDTYVEGSWTPVIDSLTAGSGRSTTVDSARYIKIGRLVYVSCRATMTTLGTGGSGIAVIRGLPFAALSDSNNYYGWMNIQFENLNTNAISISGNANADTILRLSIVTAAAANSTTGMDFATYVKATTQFQLSGVYMAAS